MQVAGLAPINGQQALTCPGLGPTDEQSDESRFRANPGSLAEKRSTGDAFDRDSEVAIERRAHATCKYDGTVSQYRHKHAVVALKPSAFGLTHNL